MTGTSAVCSQINEMSVVVATKSKLDFKHGMSPTTTIDHIPAAEARGEPPPRQTRSSCDFEIQTPTESMWGMRTVLVTNHIDYERFRNV